MTSLHLQKLSGWHATSASSLQKIYEINGRHFWAFAELEGADGDVLWTIELFMPDRDGNQPCLPASSLQEAVVLLEKQIAFLAGDNPDVRGEK